MGRDKFKDSDKVVDSFWCIARKSAESAYRRSREREGKTVLVDDVNSVE